MEQYFGEQSCYTCIHLKVCKNWAEIAGHPERLDLNLGCTMFKAVTKFAPIADTVQKMRSMIKERCIKGGIYPAFVASTIDQIAKEMSNEETHSD